jgi:hypothetical protein
MLVGWRWFWGWVGGALTNAPTTEPPEDPEMTRGSSPAWNNAFTTPRWYIVSVAPAGTKASRCTQDSEGRHQLAWHMAGLWRDTMSRRTTPHLTSRQHKCGAAKGVSRLPEEHQLLHEGEGREIVVRQVQQLVYHLRNVLLAKK